MASRTLILVAFAVLSCADASWLPWTSRGLRADLVPKNNFTITQEGATNPCLRFAAAISINVNYQTTDSNDAILQVIVPLIGDKNVDSSSCDPASLHISWGPEIATTPNPDEPTDKPSDPTDKPSDPTEKPDDPTDKPDDPTEKPDDPTEKPDDPTEKPDDPTENPDDPTDNPDDPTDNPDEATDNPDDPTDNPDDPTDNTDDPTDNPDDPADNPDDPADNADDPADNPDDPADNADDPADNPDESAVEHTKKLAMKGERTRQRVAEESPFGATPFAGTNSLHFDFGLQDGTYFLANIIGVITITDAPQDFPENIKTLTLTVTDQKLFGAPSGVVSTCSGSTDLEAKVEGTVEERIKAVHINMADVQMLAYWDEEYPATEKSCHSSATVPKLDNAAIFVLGSVAALLANLRLW